MDSPRDLRDDLREEKKFTEMTPARRKIVADDLRDEQKVTWDDPMGQPDVGPMCENA